MSKLQNIEVTNCHYISKFLTKHWNFPNKYLSIFNITTNKLNKPTASKKLFAKYKLYPNNIELFFRDYIETPLAEFIDKASKGKNPSCKQKHLDALHLLLTLQAVKLPQMFKSEVFKINKIAQDEKYRTDLLYAIRDTKHFEVLTTNYPLFFPENGIFATIPIGKFKSYAIPITPTEVVVVFDKKIINDLNYKFILHFIKMHLLPLSAGDKNFLIHQTHKCLSESQLANIHQMRQDIIKIYTNHFTNYQSLFPNFKF